MQPRAAFLSLLHCLFHLESSDKKFFFIFSQDFYLNIIVYSNIVRLVFLNVIIRHYHVTLKKEKKRRRKREKTE